MPDALDPVIESRRQTYIERLYERSGRSCGTYSGLLQEHMRDLVKQDMEQMLGDVPRQDPLRHDRVST